MKYEIVDAGYVKAHLKDMPIVDVRPEFMYEEARIPGAISIPYMTWLMRRNAAAAATKAKGETDSTEIFAEGGANVVGAVAEAPEVNFGKLFKAKDIYENTHVIVYCHSGMLAHEACNQLHDEGYYNLHCYEGSWVDWISDPENPTDDRALPSA